MYLIIDPSLHGSMHLLLLKKDTCIEKTYSAYNSDLLLCVDTFLYEQKCTLESLFGILVVIGSGGFTSTRIAVVIANTISYTKKLAIGSIRHEELGVSYENAKKFLLPQGQYISAIYSGEPNIT